MKVFVVIALPQIDKAIELSEAIRNFDYVKEAENSAKYIEDKIKSFAIEKHSDILMSRPTKIVLKTHPVNLEDLEAACIQYGEGLNTQVAIGIGENYNDANKAVIRSIKSKQTEFWHKSVGDEEDAEAENARNLNEIPDKIQEGKNKPALPMTLQEEVGSKEEYYNALAQMQLQQMMPAPAPQPAPEQVPQEGEEQADPEENQDQDPRSAMMPQEIAQEQQEPEMKSEPEQMEDVEMDPAKAEPDQEGEKMKSRISGLLATIVESLPKMNELAEKNPESFKLALKMIGSTLKMAKHSKDGTLSERLAKAAVPKFKKKFLRTPAGVIKNGKMSVKDPETGKITWRGVRTGLMQAPDGTAISAKTHNEISAGNELGKDEPAPEKKYRIHTDGQPITGPMTLKEINEKHGPVQDIEKDPSNKVIELSKEELESIKKKDLTKPQCVDSLEKMSRPRIVFPKLEGEGVPTRPDQEVNRIETPRQKKIFARKLTNDYEPSKDQIYNQIQVMKRKGSYSDNMSPEIVSQVIKDVNRDKSVRSNTPKSVTASTRRGALGSSHTYKQGKSKQKKGFQYILGDKYLSGSKTIGDEKHKRTSIEHEALHGNLTRISHNRGPKARAKVVQHLLDSGFDINNPEQRQARSALYSYITSGKGYKHAQGEEMLTHIRDILTSPHTRGHFKKIMGENAEKHISHYKRALNRMADAAKQIGPEFFDDGQE